MLAEYVQIHSDMRDLPPEDVPLATILQRWFAREAKHKASAEAYRYGLRKWLDWFEDMTIAEMTAARLDDFTAELRDRGLSQAYIRRTLAAGKAALNWAHKRGEVARVPYVQLPPEGGYTERRVLTAEQMAGLVEASLQEPEDYLTTYLLLAIGTAARKGAILDLQRFQCDLDRRVIHLNPPGREQNKKYRPSIPMADFLVPIIESSKTEHLVAYQGRRMMDIKAAFNRTRDRAGLPEDVTPYCIRHTIATELRNRGVSMQEISGLLGHQAGNRTTERYAKINPDGLSEAIGVIEAFFADLRCELAGDLSGPDVNRMRLSSVLVETPKVVEPRGIEPRTSTMPL